MNKSTPIFLTLILAAGCVPAVDPEPIPIEQCDAVSYPSTTPATAPVSVVGDSFQDSDGRTVLLRGINVAGSSKVPDFMPITSAAMLDPLSDWGINTLRLIFTWEGFESTRCNFDETYLTYYEQVVEWAADRDMYVVVDFHQDAYSRYALEGCGEGFPLWSLSSMVSAATPDNGSACEDWGLMMSFSDDNKLLFDHFLEDREGVRGAFLDMIEAVSHRLSSHPNVIGYDILNEPWGNDAQLKSLFEDAALRIREHHPDAIIFVPAHALVSGFATNTMPKPGISNFAYSPHYYDPNTFFGTYSGTDVSVRLGTHLAKASAWSVPMFLGEFGVSPETADGDIYMENIYNWLDEQFVSSAQWDYEPNWDPVEKDGWNREDFSIADDMGQLRNNFVPRPYAQKTSGTPTFLSLTANGLTYQWNNSPAAGAAGTTEIFIPAGYDTGKSLTVISASATGCSISGQLISCQIDDAGPITITLLNP